MIVADAGLVKVAGHGYGQLLLRLRLPKWRLFGVGLTVSLNE